MAKYLWFMSRKVLFTIFLTILTLITPTASFAAPKAGATCPKAGKAENLGNKRFTCIKSGKKLIWNKGVPKKSSVAPTAQPNPTDATPTPAATPAASDSKVKWPIPTQRPVSIEDLYSNRLGVAYAAWSNTAKVMNSSSPKVPPFEVLIGPNSVPWHKNYKEIIESVSKAIPNQILPKKVNIIYYNFSDLGWAESQMRKLVSADEYSEMDRSEGGALVSSNCQQQLQNCLGAKAKTLQNNEQAFLLMGVSNQVGMFEKDGGKYGSPGEEEANRKGMILAHEYFHTLQIGPMSFSRNLQRGDWPPAWIQEGSATFMQNATINSSSYENYMEYRKASLGGLIERAGMQEDFIVQFLNRKNWVSNPDWGGVSPDWSYQLGARVMEILVALKGPESTVEIFNLMSKKSGFESSFKSAFGFDFDTAVPIIAKTLAANWKEGL